MAASVGQKCAKGVGEGRVGGWLQAKGSAWRLHRVANHLNCGWSYARASSTPGGGGGWMAEDGGGEGEREAEDGGRGGGGRGRKRPEEEGDYKTARGCWLAR